MNDAESRIFARKVFLGSMKESIICPVCKTGTYKGILAYLCCDNPKCVCYDSFAMKPCLKCGVTRRDCAC